MSQDPADARMGGINDPTVQWRKPTWIRILHWEYRGHAVYDKRLKEGRSMKRINQPYKWKAYRPKSRNPESGIPEDAF